MMLQCPSCQHENPLGSRFCNDCGTALATVAEPATTGAPVEDSTGAPDATSHLGADSILAERYRVVEELGRGGMGEVVHAHDQILDRRVAIKFLPAALENDAVARERLRGEALSAAALDHPFICKIHEIGETDGRLFIVMEYVEGDTLAAILQKSTLSIRQIVDLVAEITEALAEAHDRGFIHRDLKPANLMLTAQGHVKVMDFGLAKSIAQPAADGHTVSRLTRSGVSVGTPAYMSPEQLLGGALDARSDIFSLGIVLHELVTGAHPFDRGDLTETMSAILREAPAQGSRDLESLPGLGRLVSRMLAKACAERPQSMSEVRGELQALQERARASDTSRESAAPAEPSVHRTPFVGREAERGELVRLLDRMLAGQGGLVLVGGEPGVGKTRLVQESQAAAHERGCLCLTGHCYEMEGAPPFVPFVEVLEEATRLVPQAVRASIGDAAPEIASIVPSLRRVYPDIPPMPELPPEQRRRLVFNAFLDYVRRASEKSPSVILFDDLHWADEPTLQLLLHIAPHLGSMRLLFVGTYRDVELDVDRPFAKSLETLLRQRLAVRIPLRRFDETGVHALLSSMAGSEPPSGFARVVFQETEGNPFFVEEVYQHLDEEGKLFRAGGKWREDLRLGAIEVPEGVRLVVGRRVDRLGEKARQILTAGAVIGRSFPLAVLQAVVELPEDDVLDAIDEAERAQLVAADRDRRTVRYGFVHELIRTTLVNGLSLPRRQRLHLRIADAMEQVFESSLETQISVLAHHLYQAGAAADSTRAAKAMAAAGGVAVEAGAFEEALGIFDDLMGLELPSDDPLLVEAVEQRGHALAALQRYDEAVACLEQALTHYEELQDDDGIARCVTSMAECLVWQARFEDALPVQKRGLENLSEGAQRERARVLMLSGWIRTNPSHVDDALRDLEEAHAIAERLDDRELRGLAVSSIASWHRVIGEYDLAVQKGQEALPLLPENAPWVRADSLSSLVLAWYYSGRMTECERLLPELEAAATRTGHHGALWVLERVMSGLRLHRTGDLETYLAASEQAVLDPHFRYVSKTQVAIARLYLGAVDAALEDLAAVVAEQPGEHFVAGMPEGNLFAASALAGRMDRAAELVPTLEPHLPRSDRRNVQGGFLALEAFAVGLALLGDEPRRSALYPMALANIETGSRLTTMSVGPSNPELVAALCAEPEMPDRAHEHFERALKLVREIPSRIQEPSVLFWYGRSMAGSKESEERARGRHMLEASLEGFERLNMVLHQQLARRALEGAKE